MRSRGAQAKTEPRSGAAAVETGQAAAAEAMPAVHSLPFTAPAPRRPSYSIPGTAKAIYVGRVLPAWDYLALTCRKDAQDATKVRLSPAGGFSLSSQSRAHTKKHAHLHTHTYASARTIRTHMN